MLRHIRTNLGRMLRAHHRCWVGCARDGPEPVARAALLAAERAHGPGLTGHRPLTDDLTLPLWEEALR